MVPATAENGDKITVQLAKIITIPAHQLAQCHLQTSSGSHKSGMGAPPGGLSLLGSPLTVRALGPVSVGPGTQVMRLTVPTQGQQQTLMVSQAGSVGGVVTLSTSNHTMTTQPRIISGIFNGSELVIGAPGSGGVTMEKLKAAGVHIQALAVQQNHAKSGGVEMVVQLDTPDVTIKTEEIEC